MTQRMPGVYTSKLKDGTLYFRSSITYLNKHISLGSFQAEQEAAEAYQEAGRILKSTFGIPDYTDQSILSFEKWVVLINYRDNRIYLPSPIYIRPKFFYYYLSPEDILKFDTDDLFYYSHKKIMRRKGHLFVADYGMQVNILNRYGIKNYSVAGRDYQFVNEDYSDFRYENIKIINRYMGVFLKKLAGKVTYKVKIHVKSSYVVGSYSSETEAAIAYNKAADQLIKQGVAKNFSFNYIDTISSREYAEIYSSLTISDRITNWHHFSE